MSTDTNNIQYLSIGTIETVNYQSSSIGTDINNRFTLIDQNFKSIYSSDYLKGAQGNSIGLLECAMAHGNNTGVGICLPTNKREITQDYLYTLVKNAISKQNGEWDANLNNSNITLIYKEEDGKKIIQSSLPFIFKDARFDDKNLSSINSEVEDLSCVVYYDSNKQQFVKLNAFPTLYYDSTKEDESNFYWQINGNRTGLLAQGPQGKSGLPGLSAILTKSKTASDGITSYITHFYYVDGATGGWYAVKPEQTELKFTDIQNKINLATNNVVLSLNINEQNESETKLIIGNLYINTTENLAEKYIIYHDSKNDIPSLFSTNDFLITMIQLNTSNGLFIKDGNESGNAQTTGHILKASTDNQTKTPTLTLGYGTGEPNASNPADILTIDSPATNTKLISNYKQNVFKGDIKAENIEVENNGKFGFIEKSYTELADLKNNSNLSPGTRYRITDYTLVLPSTGTIYAEHMIYDTQANSKPRLVDTARKSFDIIVEAISINEFSETAKATYHEGDDYFAGCNLEAWELKYCFDNDTDRFAWANNTNTNGKVNGKGVIYYMKDEYGNEAPYDFKNLLIYCEKDILLNKLKYDILVDQNDHVVFENENTGGITIKTISYFDNDYSTIYTIQDVKDPIPFYTFSYIDAATLSIQDATILNKRGIFENNIIKPFKDTVYVLPLNIFCRCESKNTHTQASVGNYIGYNCTGNFFGSYAESNHLNNGCCHNILGFGSKSNNFEQNCQSNQLICVEDSATNQKSVASNTFSQDCMNNVLICAYNAYCQCNTFGQACSENILLSARGNKFGHECIKNMVMKGLKSLSGANNPNYNIFGNQCTNNILEQGSGLNTFENTCKNNQLSDGCYNNSFGNSCEKIKLVSSENNSFGNSCETITLLADCQNNSFGNYCTNINQGSYLTPTNCVDNFFGNNCKTINFNYNCRRNSFGNGCNNIDLINDCSDNSFGNSCNKIGLTLQAIGNSSFSDPPTENASYNTFHNRCHDLQLNNIYNFLNNSIFGQEYPSNHEIETTSNT